MLSYPVSFSSAVSIACFFSSYNWNHSLLNIRCGSGQVIIDFSTRETSLEVLSLAVKHQKALVCGTTRCSPEEMQQFQDAATWIPVLYTANTSKLVKYNEQASGTGHFHTKKECALAHSRAERGRLRHSSSSCECASPARSAFCFIGSSFGISYEIKKPRNTFSYSGTDNLMIRGTTRIESFVIPLLHT